MDKRDCNSGGGGEEDDSSLPRVTRVDLVTGASFARPADQHTISEWIGVVGGEGKPRETARRMSR